MGEYFPTAIPREAPPSIGQGAAALRVTTIPLDDARTSQRFVLKGSFIWAIAASDILANIDVQFNDQSGTAFPFRRGAVVGGLPFSEIYVTNTAQAGKSITLLTVMENPIGPFRVENPDIAFNEVTVTTSTTSDDIADATLADGAGATIAADSTRRSLVFQSLDGELLVGPNATSNRGIRVPSGQTYTHIGTAALKIYNQSGGPRKYTYIEYKD